MTKQDRTTFETIPAASGWYCSMLYSDTNHLTDEPIVAWEIERWDDGEHRIGRVVTWLCAQDEVNDCNYPYALRDPAGRYHCPDGSKFDSADDAFAHLKTRASKKTVAG